MAKWMVYTKKADFRAISEACGISPVLARVIRNRDVIGIEATRRFLGGTISDLWSPRLLPDMEKAVGILCEKIKDSASIRVIGDYDVDGICASYILMSALSACGASADVVLPDRVKDGYGMNVRMAEDAAEDGTGVILTCDNGIAAGEAVLAAKEAGICVIVTDHHEVPLEEDEDGKKKYILPPADAVVDPKIHNPLTGEMDYPFPEICGAVVAWKLADLLMEKLIPEKRSGVLEQLLPFCALATVCDVMPLADENRILVREGLRRIRDTENIGLKSLLLVNGLEEKAITTYHAGFVIGPCLNATGRLDNAERALALFMEDDPGRALRSAQKLRELNDSRKSLTEDGVEQALELVSRQHLLDYRILVIYLPECHESLAGIIAGRIRERFSRPVFVLTRTEDGMVKGSGRSIEAYDMFASMTEVKELFSRFGGHKMAAGLSMKEENIPALQQCLEEKSTLREEDLTEVIHIDMELPPSRWTVDMVEELKLLEPCGTDNPRPMFAARGVKLRSVKVMGKGKNVLGFEAVDSNGRNLSLTMFREAGLFREQLAAARGSREWNALLRGHAEVPVSMIYHPEINEWRGRKSIRFVIKDLHF